MTRQASIMKRGSSAYTRMGSALGSTVTLKPYAATCRDLHADIPSPRFVPSPMKILTVSYRRKLNLEILWILCRLHGKVRASTRGQTKRGVAVHPEDSYAVLEQHLGGDVV